MTDRASNPILPRQAAEDLLERIILERGDLHNLTTVEILQSAMNMLMKAEPGRLPCCLFRGLLSVHSRYGLWTRQVAYSDPSIEGFIRFVTSSNAPIATGWSDSCQVGLPPTENACLFTAHSGKPRLHATR